MVQPRRAESPPLRWNAILRALREASGVTQDGWSAYLGYSRTTIQRWERGAFVPDADAERALLAVLREKGLLRAYGHGALAGVTVTEDLLRDAFAEGRAGTAPAAGTSARADGARPHDRARPLAPDPARTNLSARHTSFVGRDDERATVRRLLGRSRLVTLTGTGGVGKTRLAVETAAELVDDYAGGVWLVELAALADPAFIPQAAAQALGVREAPNTPILDGLVAALQEAPRLLLLDNCEHLVAGAGAFAETLLRRCPSLRILATSRAALGVIGETVWWVPSLAVPSPESSVLSREERHAGLRTQDSGLPDSVRLFADRAEAAHPAFALTDDNAAAVAAICRRLDGMPLAIELAAARARILTPAQIAARLDERFRLLAGGSPDAPGRQQTLRAALDWSHDLLTAPERTLLARLAVFAGGCDLEAVEAVCVDDLPPDPLPEGKGGPTDRFSQPSADSQPGAASTPGSQRNSHGGSPSLQGGGRGVGHDALFDLLASLVQQSLITVEYRGEAARYRMLESVREYAAERLDEAGEAEDTRARLRGWAIALLDLAAPHLRGPQQSAWLDRLDAEHDTVRAVFGDAVATGRFADGLRLAGRMGGFWSMRGHWSEGRYWFDRLLPHAATAPAGVRALALLRAGKLAEQQGAYDEATPLVQQSLDLFQEVGDREQEFQATSLLGMLAWRRSDLVRSAAYHEAALALARDIGNGTLISSSLNNLAVLAMDGSQLGAARDYLDEALGLARAAGDAAGIVMRLDNRAMLAIRMGDLPLARACSEEALALGHRAGIIAIGPNLLRRLAEIHLGLGDADTARRYAEEALAEARARGDQFEMAEALDHLARIAVKRSAAREAGSYSRDSLRIAAALGTRRQIWFALYRLGQVARQDGDWRRAVTLFAAEAAIRAATGEVQPDGAQREVDDCFVALSAEHGDAAVAAAWAEGTAMSADQAIEYALAAGA